MRVTAIQSLSAHDGPGLRTVIFLAGCPLACPWCHNPEAREAGVRLSYHEALCISCGACASVCKSGAHRVTEGRHTLERTACRGAGDCVAVCPTGALSLTSRPLTEGELFTLSERERRLGGGGLTFSGGEPLLYIDALEKILPRLAVHTAIETCGYADEATFLRALSLFDYVMMDIKLASDALHRRYTGKSNAPILKNLELLRKSGRPFLLRTPLIPGITDTEENLAAIADIVGGDPWERLPYNSAAREKHERLGLRYEI